MPRRHRLAYLSKTSGVKRARSTRNRAPGLRDNLSLPGLAMPLDSGTASMAGTPASHDAQMRR
jgi:hypothetical protein